MFSIMIFFFKNYVLLIDKVKAYETYGEKSVKELFHPSYLLTNAIKISNINKNIENKIITLLRILYCSFKGVLEN